jgi:hypothetical protein
MGAPATIGGGGQLFIGTDKLLKLFVYDRVVTNVARYSAANLPLGINGQAIVPMDANGVVAVPIDMTGWTTAFVVRKLVTSPDPPLILKTPSIVGTYSADPTVNTMHLEVQLVDDDLALTVFTQAATYQQSWKRLDEGAEDVLAYGDFILERATQT